MSIKKIVSAGHICLDITPAFPDSMSGTLGSILKPGSLIEMDAANVHIGGSVSNTGLGLKLMGADVTLMGKIGKDSFGIIVQEQLSEYVSTEYMIESDADATSYSVVLAPKGTDRIFLHCPGANDTFRESDLNYDLIKEANLFHFGYPPLMKTMYAKGGEELVKMFEKVQSLGTATSLDTASVDENSPAGQVDWKQLLTNVLPYVDFFVPSVEELAFMVDRPLYREWKQRAGEKDITSIIKLSEVECLAERVLDMGVGVVLLKCGTPGLFLATGSLSRLSEISSRTNADFFGWDAVRHFERSYLPKQVRSATGAGDTAIAAFLYAALSEYSWQECLQFATAAGAACVEEYDAISGIKSFEELKKRIDAGWEKQLQPLSL